MDYKRRVTRPDSIGGLLKAMVVSEFRAGFWEGNFKDMARRHVQA